jgi:Rne/Rng family ribonuclease
MSKELVISAAPHETRVAILEDGQLCEIYIEREKEFALVGSIYKGRVTRVLPGMQSAFVDIGLDSDAFLYVGDFLENLEDYDHVVTAVEGKVQKMEQQGGEVFAPPSNSEISPQQPTFQAQSPAERSATQEPASPESPSHNDSSVLEKAEYSQPPLQETPPPPGPFTRQ